jgi:hypothetical protein
MGIGLTVIAIADHAIDRPGRRIGDDAPYLPATATHLNLSAHGLTLLYSGNRLAALAPAFLTCSMMLER